MTIPWLYFGLALGISLLVSAAGFSRVYYFVSVCYAGSIAAQSVVMALLFQDSISGWALLQLLLLFVYGVRLAGFLLMRERSAAYQKELAAIELRTAKVTENQKRWIWFGVSLLFSLLFLPALLALSAQQQGVAVASLPFGVAVMLLGLGLESWADWQKYRFKSANPSRFCDVELYRVVRCPNYLGEMLFWLGVWLSAVSAYQSALSWLLTSVALVYMQLLMVGAARNVELKQDERYGAQPDYQAYVRSVPILLPWLPVYSLRKLKFLVH
ncbi:MAG TPA: DUF1295 domain-containing protein [Rhodopseudomonas sp.]|uniref:DUF1295 domain-containing protein n=1 Tax=Rhodopseudomonas sp. TaxID=1078 RepID=UPI002ED9C2BF